MEINENAPGNVSQSPVTRPTDNETGFTPDLEADLGHGKAGDTKPLPASNEPLAPGVDNASAGPSQGGTDGDQITTVDQMNSPDSPALNRSGG